MLKTSHLQELKRRYREMYAPKPEELDEHCGVCGEGGEQGIEEGKPSRKLAQRDVGMECQECGKKFRSKLSTLQYGKTKCPKCKSTDLDFAFGESVEVKEDTDKDEPGTQGDKEEYQKKRKEIAAKFGVKSCSALKDEKERKACYAALDAAHVSDDEEEDEDDDPVGKNEEVEIEEGVSEKDYDSLKKGDIVTIEYKGAMSSGKSSFKVTAKNIVGKAKVGKVTLQSTKNPKGVKHFLYKRGNKVSFAQGDMAASVVKYTIEEVEIDESLALQMKMAASDVFDILRKNKYSAGPQGDTLVRNLVKKSKGKGSKKGDAQWVANKIMKDYPGLKKEEAEIYEGYEKAVLLSLEDEGIEGHFEYGKVVVAKRDVKRAKETLDNDPDIRRTPKIVGEEVDLDEKKSGTGYQLYHKDFSSAMQHAYVHAKKKGFIVDPKEIDDKVATGPKKPSSGKTNRYILGTDKKKNVHIQVANLDNKRYELNMYIESIDDHLGKVKNILKRINLNEVDLDERRAETPAEWEKRTGKKPTKQTFDKAQADKKKDAFLKAYQGTKEKEKPKKTTSVRKQRYVQKPSYRTREVPYREKPAEIAQHFKLPDYIVHDDIKKFPRILMGGIDKIAPGVKFQKHVISHQTFGKIPGLGIFLPGDSSPKLMIQWNQRINDPKIDYIWADPKYAEKGTDPSTYRKNDMVVWINEAATNNPALKGKVDWYQRKEFEGATPDDAAKRTLQYLKTKIKRMAKEEVELASMTEEIQKLEERRQSFSNFIPFPQKVMTDFAKRALKAGLTFDQYMKYVKGTFKDGADSNNAIIFGRDVYKKKKGAVDPDAWSLKREEVVVEREMTDSEKDKREEIVISLKKKTKDFKERYGDKWKEVMYATATKMAMGEEEEKPKSKKKDKINLKPKMDETMKTYKDLIKGLKESNPKPQTEETSIKEGVTEQGVEYGEQDWDLEMRPDALYPNLNVNFAEFMESGLEGPYLFKGEHYFFDRKINGWYSMSSEDYVSEAEAEELHMAYNKHGLTKAQFSN